VNHRPFHLTVRIGIRFIFQVINCISSNQCWLRREYFYYRFNYFNGS